VSGTKGNLIGKEWLENYKVYGPNLLKKLVVEASETVIKPIQELLGTNDSYDIESMDRYKEVDAFMLKHVGEVTNFVGHSKGASVVDVWMKNHPEFKGYARLYGTPYDDPIGKERFKDYLNKARTDRQEYYKNNVQGPSWLESIANTIETGKENLIEYTLGLDKVKGMQERHQLRIANEGDFAAALDGSVKVFWDPTSMNHLSQGGGHFYGSTASLFAGFDGKDGDGDIPNDESGNIDEDED
jgi:hypothetical protein